MKNLCGTIGFVILGMVTFRFVYAAWPPFDGNFGQWMSSDPKTRWAMVAGIVGGMVGAFIGRAIARILGQQEGKINEALECSKLGLLYHQQKSILWDSLKFYGTV